MLGAYLVFFSTVAFMPLWVALLICACAVLVFYGALFGWSKKSAALPLALAGAFAAGALYSGFFAPGDFRPPWGVAVIFAIAVTSACGILVDRAAYRPLRDAPRISALISAIGISFLIENLGVVLFTGLPRPVVQPEILATPIRVSLSALTGVAMRSISKDIETTRLMGVSVDKVIALTFGLGSALAAAAGIMWALRYPQIHPYMGILPGFKAFIAAVIGGIGSIQGAMIGGLMLGFIEILVVAFYPTLSGYRDAFAFVLLIFILLCRPTGLLGEKLEDKI